MKSLADSPDSMFEHRWFRDAPFDPANENTEVRAPCCGRRVIACAVADVREIAGTVVAGGGFLAAQDHDWLCDSCRSRLYRDAANDWTPSKLMTLCGAPPEGVRAMLIREQLDAMAAADAVAGVPHDPTAASTAAAEEVDLALAAAAAKTDSSSAS